MFRVPALPGARILKYQVCLAIVVGSVGVGHGRPCHIQKAVYGRY
jgi:hypothetical protein